MNINFPLDIMLVKQFAFILIISSNLKFITDYFIPNRRQ